MEYYSDIKEILPFAATRMKLGGTIREISQKEILYHLTYTCELKEKTQTHRK